jgi:hypothetical protein
MTPNVKVKFCLHDRAMRTAAREEGFIHIEVTVNAPGIEKKTKINVICILYMTPLPAIRMSA